MAKRKALQTFLGGLVAILIAMGVVGVYWFGMRTTEYATPEMVVRVFLTAVREGNLEEAAKCMKPEHRDGFGRAFGKIRRTLSSSIPDAEKIKLESVVKEEGGKKTAIVKVLNVAELSGFGAPVEFLDGRWWLAVQRAEERPKSNPEGSSPRKPPKSPEEIEAFLNRIRNASLAEQQDAVEKLSRLGSKAEKALMTAVKNDDDAVRDLALQTLTMIKPDPEAFVPLLVDVLKHDTSTRVRATAAEALGVCGDTTADEDESAITTADEDEDPDAVAAMVKELELSRKAKDVAGMTEDTDVVAAEDVPVVGTPADHKEQPKSIFETHAIPALVEALGDSEGAVRMAAVEAIGTIGIRDEHAVRTLLKLADDEDAWVAFRALFALCEITGSQYVDRDYEQTVDSAGGREITARLRKKGGQRLIERVLHIPSGEQYNAWETMRVIRAESTGEESPPR